VDIVFLEGIAAVVAALIVFFGSVFLLMAVIMGPRLSYFVTASVTFGFVTIMGVVWSLAPLGPIGDMPEWLEFGIGTAPAEIDLAPITAYPQDPWRLPDVDDEHEQTLAAELETDADDMVAAAIADAEIPYESAGDLELDAELTRFVEHQGELFGAVTYTPAVGVTGPDVIVVMQSDPGDPLGPARMITAGTALLFVGHLFGLSRAERKARERKEAAGL
jgi:hypothetical protein